MTQRIHVWFVYLHLVDFCCQCRLTISAFLFFGTFLVALMFLIFVFFFARAWVLKSRVLLDAHTFPHPGPKKNQFHGPGISGES